MTNARKSRDKARSEVTHVPIQIVNTIDAAVLDNMPLSDRIGAVLAMSQNGHEQLMRDHGGELDGLSVRVLRKELPASNDMPAEAVYELTFEQHRPVDFEYPENTDEEEKAS